MYFLRFLLITFVFIYLFVLNMATNIMLWSCSVLIVFAESAKVQNRTQCHLHRFLRRTISLWGFTRLQDNRMERKCKSLRVKTCNTSAKQKNIRWMEIAEILVELWALVATADSDPSGFDHRAVILLTIRDKSRISHFTN